METETAVEWWSGPFGDEYSQRNRVVWEERVPFWRRILDLTQAKTFCEVGVNEGWNFHAIRRINPEVAMSGVDVNQAAVEQAKASGFDVEKAQGSEIVGLFGTGVCDLAFTSGVLIHIPPEELKATMAAIRDVSAQWVLAIEYEADTEQGLDYRGHAERLWKRPFGKLYEELGLQLIESGPAVGFNDCKYWLLEKT